MAVAPYFAPTYFPPSYFLAAAEPGPISVAAGATPYNAPTYFSPSYFLAPVTPAPVAAGATPYNAPTYFPPSYFFAPVAPVSVAVGATPYNAPTYFSPSYFLGGPSVTPVDPVDPTAPVSPGGLDGAAYLSLLNLLGGTKVFDGVIFGDPSRRGQAGSGRYPLAVVSPEGWEELDDCDPTSILRRVWFTIRVVIRAEGEDEPFEQLDTLASAVRAVVNGSDLGGLCVPGLTRISNGRYEGAGHYPEWSADLLGEFTSIVEPAANPAASA